MVQGDEQGSKRFQDGGRKRRVGTRRFASNREWEVPSRIQGSPETPRQQTPRKDAHMKVSPKNPSPRRSPRLLSSEWSPRSFQQTIPLKPHSKTSSPIGPKPQTSKSVRREEKPIPSTPHSVKADLKISTPSYTPKFSHSSDTDYSNSPTKFSNTPTTRQNTQAKLTKTSPTFTHSILQTPSSAKKLPETTNKPIHTTSTKPTPSPLKSNQTTSTNKLATTPFYIDLCPPTPDKSPHSEKKKTSVETSNSIKGGDLTSERVQETTKGRGKKQATKNQKGKKKKKKKKKKKRSTLR
eukprot:TRINITY_DN4736_c0_g1_i1.p1 TRINITY_DN4736_c0_g1~~TRINITY_DN4736_c0_g1_i1.p1  ORF type:complete len:295 (-),score=85.93 TRINITY_DN4736_c0_g1_i1:10-894(-)